MNATLAEQLLIPILLPFIENLDTTQVIMILSTAFYSQGYSLEAELLRQAAIKVKEVVAEEKDVSRNFK